MRILHLLFFVVLLSPIFGYSQPCGTVSKEDRDAIVERLLANRASLESGIIQDREVTYIPITYHLIGKNDGSGRVNESRLLDNLCLTNEYYAPANIQFYIKSLRYNINNTLAYNDPGGSFLVLSSSKDNKAINVYIGNRADPPNGSGLGTTLGYYTPQYDWLVVKISEFNGTNSTLAHEIGHFLSLPHPFNGWDSEVWSLATHGSPVGPNSPGGTPNECQNGSNCMTAGDFICDTPPDYNFGFGASGCNFTTQVLDPCGDVVDPMEVNIMGYFLNCDVRDYKFTPNQMDLMNADYLSAQRGYLRSDPQPSFPPLGSEAPTGIRPINDEVTNSYVSVIFEWEAVSGANAYIFEIDRFSGFNVQPYRKIVYGNRIELENVLLSDRNYFWRVRPFNGVNVCAPNGPTNTFKTGTGTTATNEIESIGGFQVIPNPVRSNAELIVQFAATDATKNAQISVFHINGQSVLNKQVDIIAGDNQFNLSTDKMSPGLYFVQLRTANGTINKRVVVQ